MTKAEAIAMLKRIQEPEAWEPQINQAAFEALDMAIEALEQEPETAHWIKVPDEETFFCSKCNARLYDEQIYLPFNYCPNCGAKMIEQQGSEE